MEDEDENFLKPISWWSNNALSVA